MRTARLGKALASVAALILCTTPVLAQVAARRAEKPSSDRTVSLRLERADIRTAIKELFTSQGVSYTLDDSITGTVTVSLEGVPFGTALNTVLRNASPEGALTYRVEKGIFNILSEPARKPAVDLPPPVKLQINFLPVEQLVRQLRQMAPYKESAELSYQANSADSSLLVTGTPEAVRQLMQGVRLLDVQPRQVMVRAELVLVADSNAGKGKKRVIWSPMMRGLNAQEMAVRVESSGAGKGIDLNNLIVTPRINADNSVTLDASWTGDITVRVDAKSQPLRIQHKASSTVRTPSGSTIVLTGTIVKRSGNEPDAELLLFLTPTIIPEAGERTTAR
jgi:type II secretory pathway component GspD/PulD (secretin)